MTNTKKSVTAGLLLAAALYLPFLTGQIPQVGSMLSPMHIPVLLCGFLCGAPYGLAVGAIAPLLRFALFGMPPLFPTGLAMTFELAAYGLCSGLFYKLLPKRPAFLYADLMLSMLVGRIVWGMAMFVISLISPVQFNMNIFIAGAFVKAVPGIILHIALIPVIVLTLQKAGYLTHE